MKTKNFSYTWIRKINEQKLQYISSNKLKYILKLLIPLLTLISLIILIFWALEISKNSVTQMGFGKGAFKEDVMIGPKLYTNNYQNRKVEIKANSAKKFNNNDSIILLERPNGNTYLTKTNTINFAAKKGIYDKNIGQLNLSEEVHIWSTKGTNFFTEKITYDIDSGIFSSDASITLFGPWGSLVGKGVFFNTKTSIIRIKEKPILKFKIENDK